MLRDPHEIFVRTCPLTLCILDYTQDLLQVMNPYSNNSPP